ncbi:methyltransferase [Fusarium heterosporum]|uniref:Methyltransferase n=1 Tax=Fusarium heterosporum TaxID=42747 RepID=A0A8H5X2L5_FUSHE|nr:methyltransferase [Fusarium heterosporum]
MATATEQLAHEPLAADTFDDSDSTFSGADSESLESLRSSIMRYQEENGRTYHAMSSGKYNFPNDESESERLDLQHNLWLLTLHGELGLSPKIKESAKRVLDAGTGTGLWAIEYADLHPEAQVTGVDLSPIQPTMVPPNCTFEIDDLEKEWTWSEPFDFIFARTMTGSFADTEKFIQNAYANLEPGGYLEMQDLTYPIACDDDTLLPDSALVRSGLLSIEASAKAGREIDLPPKYKNFFEKAGFTEIVEKKYKWPINEWPKDKHHKELGKWSYANMNEGLEGLLLALFTRFLGWSADEVRVLCSAMRKQLRDRNVHAYIPIYVVYGKKPLEEPITKTEATESTGPTESS